MRNIATLAELANQNAIKESTIPIQVGQQSLPKKSSLENSSDYANRIFSKLCEIFPAWKAAVDDDKDDFAKAYKKQMMLAFSENDVRTGEQVSQIMVNARKSENPFMPSVGQLVAWSKPEPEKPYYPYHEEAKDTRFVIGQIPTEREEARGKWKELKQLTKRN